MIMTENGSENITTQYWAKKAADKIKEMRALKAYGLFPKKEGWRNVVEHLLVESEVVDVLGEACPISAEERKELNQAALLHDAYKRRQRELINQFGDEGQKLAAKEQDEFILSRGYSPKVVELTESTGHTSLEKLVENPIASILKLKENIDLLTLIIHYADDITSGSKIVSIDKRIDALENRQPPYPEATLGGDIFGGRTYYQVQRIVGHLIEKKLAPLLEVEDPTKIPEFILTRIEERISKQ